MCALCILSDAGVRYLVLSRWRWWSPCCRCGCAPPILTRTAAPGGVWGSGALSAAAPSCLKPSCPAPPASTHTHTKAEIEWWMPLCSPALAIWLRKQSVTLCLLSTAALTDTVERPSLLTQRSHYPDPRWHTFSLHIGWVCMCSGPSRSYTHEVAHVWVFFFFFLSECVIMPRRGNHIYINISIQRDGFLYPFFTATHLHTTKPTLHLTPDSR